MHISTLILTFAFLLMATCALALMPPEVYVERIENSKIRVIATVKSVDVIETTPARILKKVTLTVTKSLGETDPGKELVVQCYSVGKEPMVGGTIYYNPVPEQRVYVTVQKPGEEVSSLTPLSAELEKALLEAPETVKPGLGVVRVEAEAKAEEAKPEPRLPAEDCPVPPAPATEKNEPEEDAKSQ